MGRRALAQRHPKLHSHVVDFAALPRLPKVDDVFIALGTTIKVAGSQQAFRAIDFDAVVAVASAARSSGATHLGVVSAMGASARSAVFYNRVKGEMEQAVSALGYDSVVIARPSMLAGDRESLDQPVRTGERVGLAVMALFRAVTPANLRAIAAGDVATAWSRRSRRAGAARTSCCRANCKRTEAPQAFPPPQPRTNSVTSGSGPT
ncbi:epimerase [Candidatus Skiveiella danica]|uniref:epimerase n=1 Tax=Candidatus Skiveiella danica TaxID=3386177 RepID=UPI0039B97314